MNNQAFSKIWIVVILAVLVVGGILVYQSWTPKEELKPSEKVTKQEEVNKKEQIIKEMIEEAKKWPGAAETGITEETAPEIIKPGQDVEGWETYSNEEVVYQIEYPAKWIVIRRQFSNCGTNCKYAEDLLIQNMPYVSFPGNGPEDGSVFGIRIFEISSPLNLTIRSWIESGDIPEQQKQQRISRIKTIDIDGAEREVSTGVMDVNWQQGITFVDDNKVYNFTYFSGSVEQFSKDLDIFKEMLSTFRFLD